MKYTTKTIREVDYNVLDRAITEFLKDKEADLGPYEKYGYECVAANEWGNYQSHSFTVDGDIDAEGKEEIMDGDNYGTSDILNWMAEEGVIGKGEYLISVSW